nr:hypothetical protein [Polyangiaceae bacterium]
EQTAQCGTCYDGVAPCGTVTTSVKDCAVNELSPESFSTDDPGDCSDKTLETLFLNRFFPYRRRCFPCHFDGETAHAEAPRFVATGPCEIASLTTYRRLIDLGAFNTSAPEKSRLLLKPLDEALGGIEHGGDSKIHSKDEATYTSFLYFLERYAECANMKP